MRRLVRGSDQEPAEVTEVPPPLISKEFKKRWSYFIQKVYETDPLICAFPSYSQMSSTVLEPVVKKEVLVALLTGRKCRGLICFGSVTSATRVPKKSWREAIPSKVRYGSPANLVDAGSVDAGPNICGFSGRCPPRYFQIAVADNFKVESL